MVHALIYDLVTRGVLLPGYEEPALIRSRRALLSANAADRDRDRDRSDRARRPRPTAAPLIDAQQGAGSARFGGLIITHARAAEDWWLLARMWTDHGLLLAIRFPKEARTAYRDIPNHAIAEHPELLLASSVVSALDSDLDPERRKASINNLRQAGWALHPFAVPTRSPSILEATARMISARLDGEVLTASRLAAEYAETHLKPRTSEISILHRAWFELQWAVTAFAARDVSRAIRLLASAANDAETVAEDAIVSMASALSALMNILLGHTRVGAESLDEHHAVRAGDQWLDHPARVAGRIAEGILKLDRLDQRARDRFELAGAEDLEEWAIIAWARTQHSLLFGDPILAMTELDRLASLHRPTLRPEGTNRRIIDRCIADLYLVLGEFNRAQKHIQDAGSPPTLAVSEARLAFICGDYSTARSIAAAHAWDPAVTLRDRIDLIVLKAGSAYRMGDAATAQILMTRVVRLAADAHTLIPYTTLPERLCHDLLSLVDHDLDDHDLLLIDRHRQPYPERGELVVLTPRETVVLHAMVEHETLADIADVLVVSLNTVKKQAHAVYEKLGVHDRRSALLRAHRLGLLSSSEVSDPGASALGGRSRGFPSQDHR